MEAKLVTGAVPSVSSLIIPRLLAKAKRSLSVDPTCPSFVDAHFKSWLTASVTVASFLASCSSTGWPVTSESSPRVTLGALERRLAFFSDTATSGDGLVWGLALISLSAGGETGSFSATTSLSVDVAWSATASVATGLVAATGIFDSGFWDASSLGERSSLAGTSFETGEVSAVLGCPTWEVKAGSWLFVATSSAWTWRAKTTGLINKLANTIETRLDFFIYKLLWNMSFWPVYPKRRKK